MKDYAIEIRHISKSFPGVKALDSVSFNVRKGAVHAVVGENGAGKSTLMKIINGMLKADEGEIIIDGKKAEITSPRVAAELGVAMIFQELLYVPNLSVGENLVIGEHPLKKNGLIDWNRIWEEADALLEEEKIDVSAHTIMQDMTISDIQMVEILKATREEASIVIMDEPTSSLTQNESQRLFDKIVRMREEGRTIIYISHKMDEIFELADDVTVLRDGKTIETAPLEAFSRKRIVSQMVGRNVESVYPECGNGNGEVVLEVKGLTSHKVFEDISFYLKKGEIIGLAGLVGAGRTEIVSAICGLDPYDSGEVLVGGEPCEIDCVNDAIASGIALATEDRRRYGLVACRSIKENITLPNLNRFETGVFINQQKEKKEAQDYFDRMDIKALGLNTEVYTLSGGNQQKVVLAKWMMSQPDVLILDEPTRGIDVGAKQEIYEMMRDMTEAGVSIIMISSELPELIGMSNRVYVVADGKISGELEADEISQVNIMTLATGGM